MNIHLKQYFEIYLKYPVEKYLTKDERKNRHKMLLDWENADIKELPSLDELIDFIKKNRKTIQINPQFFKKFESVWKENIKNGHQFAQFIIEMNLEEMMWQFNISPMELVSSVLKYNPNHINALKLKLKTLMRYHGFSLHELPWGVLAEGNLDEELQSVKEMEEVADKLGYKHKDFERLIDYCKTYYPLWFEYLKVEEKEGFEKFLKTKGMDTERIMHPYTLFHNSI